MVTERRATEYNMKHKNRGRALIFNHMYCDNLEPRKGTDVDCKNFKKELKRLDFQVDIYQDYRYEQIKKTIKEAASQNHSDNDCILVAVLSHGKKGYIHAKDTSYQVEKLWYPFTSDKCPSLAGKPKLFFIQACQGKRVMDATTFTACSIESYDDSWTSYTIPVHADFLIAYSTIPGFISYRNPQKGSWFLQSLCAELAENGKRLDLLTLLTFVCQRVAIDFETHNVDNPERNEKKQMPCIATMLTRILRFEDK
ncbi:hypothetical protein KR054_011228 [Drosophila jambulina]|nr:hypothetical protein KR054_011228 [Drosophila jambulina]